MAWLPYPSASRIFRKSFILAFETSTCINVAINISSANHFIEDGTVHYFRNITFFTAFFGIIICSYLRLLKIFSINLSWQFLSELFEHCKTAVRFLWGQILRWEHFCYEHFGHMNLSKLVEYNLSVLMNSFRCRKYHIINKLIYTVQTHNKHTPNKHFPHNKHTLFAPTKMCLFWERDFGKINSLYFKHIFQNKHIFLK